MQNCSLKGEGKTYKMRKNDSKSDQDLIFKFQ